MVWIWLLIAAIEIVFWASTTVLMVIALAMGWLTVSEIPLVVSASATDVLALATVLMVIVLSIAAYFAQRYPRLIVQAFLIATPFFEKALLHHEGRRPYRV